MAPTASCDCPHPMTPKTSFVFYNSLVTLKLQFTRPVPQSLFSMFLGKKFSRFSGSLRQQPPPHALFTRILATGIVLTTLFQQTDDSYLPARVKKNTDVFPRETKATMHGCLKPTTRIGLLSGGGRIVAPPPQPPTKPSVNILLYIFTMTTP